MCCSGFLKIMAIIFNACIFLAGAALLGVGLWKRVHSGSLLGILDQIPEASELLNFSFLLIAVGAVLLIIGFLGCCGAVGESRCMLMTFFSILLIIFIIKVSGALVLLIFRNVAKERLQAVEKGVIKSIANKYGSNTDLTIMWDSTMVKFACCGYRNYTDFEGSPFHNNGSLFPSGCCHSTMVTCTEINAEKSAVDGCFVKFKKVIRNNAMIVAGVVIGVVTLEMGAMVVSMVLYDDIRNKARVPLQMR